jgi:hypothetical protein
MLAPASDKRRNRRSAGKVRSSRLQNVDLGAKVKAARGRQARRQRVVGKGEGSAALGEAR